MLRFRFFACLLGIVGLGMATLTMSAEDSTAAEPDKNEPAPSQRDFTIIAHRGASAYLPEHTLAAKAYAYALGVDIIEQDLILTKDDVPLILHDIHLDTVTDVAKVFPNRARDDGRFYAIDFTLEEIRQLHVTERLNRKTGKAAFPNRFPAHSGEFHIATLEDDLQLMRGLDHSTGRTVALYAELKQAAFHRKEGKDLSREVLKVYSQYGYTGPEDPVLVQCFDADELKRIRFELKSKLRISQLVDRPDWLKFDAPPEALREGLMEIATYAQGVSAPLHAIFGDSRDDDGQVVTSGLVPAAHAQGLFVHVWTYRADGVPKPFKSFDELLDASQRVRVDGYITDFPDLVKQHLEGSR